MYVHHYLAHAEEFHQETTSSFEHSLTEPLGFTLAVLLAIGTLIVLGRVFKWHYGTMILAGLGILFGGGVFGYTYMPALGAVLIALGITLALGFVLIGLANERNEGN